MKGFGETQRSKKNKTSSSLKGKAIIENAFRFHSEGNISKAAEYYQAYINKGFLDPLVLSNYGVILYQAGNTAKAISLYQKSIQEFPQSPQAYSNLGNIYASMGDHDKAISHFQKATSINHNYLDAYYNLGKSLIKTKRFNEAEDAFKESLRINPKCPKSHHNLGVIKKEMNDLAGAEISTRKAIEFDPNLAEAHNNLGVILKSKNKLYEARLAIEKAILIRPNYSEALSNLGNISREMGDFTFAKSAYNKSIINKTDFEDAFYNLGILEKFSGNHYEAERITRKALELNPNSALSNNNLGEILILMDRVKEAKKFINKSIEIDPEYAEAYANLGQALILESDFLSAKQYLQKAINISTENYRYKAAMLYTLSRLSEYQEQEKYNSNIINMGTEGESIDPLLFLTLEDSPKRHLQRSRNIYNKKFKRDSSNIIYRQKTKINIGYFSADFRDHPVMHIMEGLFKNHDKDNFNIFAYYFGGEEDMYTKKVRNSVDYFHNISNLNHLETVKKARKDELDIAIDLMGYSKKHRMPIFSYRVAPVQINYLGFPGSSGSDEIDYLIADEIVIPRKSQIFYSEKVIYMPNCYMCFDNERKISKKQYERKDFGLKENSFILAAFHRNEKITLKEINSWSRILLKIPDSILWLSTPNEIAKKNLISAFTKKGVDQHNIIFAERLKSSEEHLARHSCADVFVDTFNYNAQSTGIDSLWAGLPVISLQGESFSSRVSSSFLINLGLTDLVAHSIDEYEEKVLDLFHQPGKLDRIKNTLKDMIKDNPLFNSLKSTQDIEKIYFKMIDKLKDGNEK